MLTYLIARHQVLTDVWYKYDEEYSLTELDPVLLFDRLEYPRHAPKGTKRWPKCALIWTYLLRRASVNTNETPMVPEVPLKSGKQLFAGLGLSPLPDPERDEYTTATFHIVQDYLRVLAPKYLQVSKQHFDAARNGEKTSNWAVIPTTQRLLTYYMQLHAMDVKLFHAKLNPSERAALLYDFNSKDPSSVQHLVSSPEVGGVGINMQEGHHIVILFDALELNSIIVQVIGRAYRINQHHDVYAYLYHVEGTHDEWCANRCFNAAIVQLHASLDPQAFYDWTGARPPPGHDPDDFLHSLKRSLEGFYYNDSAPALKRLRHVTSFDNVTLKVIEETGADPEEYLDAEVGDQEEFAGCTRYTNCFYRVPIGWSPLFPVGVMRRIYQMVHGTTIPGIVEDTLTFDEFRHTFGDVKARPDGEFVPEFADQSGSGAKRKREDEICEFALTMTLPDQTGADVLIWSAKKSDLESAYKRNVAESEQASISELKKWKIGDWRIALHAVWNSQNETECEIPSIDDFNAFKASIADAKRAHKKQRAHEKAQEKAQAVGGVKLTAKGHVSTAADARMKGRSGKKKA